MFFSSYEYIEHIKVYFIPIFLSVVAFGQNLLDKPL